MTRYLVICHNQISGHSLVQMQILVIAINSDPQLSHKFRFVSFLKYFKVFPNIYVQQIVWSLTSQLNIRKVFYGINTLVVANDLHLICALDPDWPGSSHDAHIWRESIFKPLIEQNRRFLLAGDSAFPISDVLVKPYSTRDAMDDRRKRLFNIRLSGLRTVMTENVYGIWKQRFPCLRNLRCHYQNTKDTIIATAILHNLAILWGDRLPPDDEQGHPEEGQAQYVIEDNDATANIILQRGFERHDMLCEFTNRHAPERRRERRMIWADGRKCREGICAPTTFSSDKTLRPLPVCFEHKQSTGIS